MQYQTAAEGLKWKLKRLFVTNIQGEKIRFFHRKKPFMIAGLNFHSGTPRRYLPICLRMITSLPLYKSLYRLCHLVIITETRFSLPPRRCRYVPRYKSRNDPRTLLSQSSHRPKSKDLEEFFQDWGVTNDRSGSRAVPTRNSSEL